MLESHILENALFAKRWLRDCEQRSQSPSTSSTRRSLSALSTSRAHALPTSIWPRLTARLLNLAAPLHVDATLEALPPACAPLESALLQLANWLWRDLLP